MVEVQSDKNTQKRELRITSFVDYPPFGDVIQHKHSIPEMQTIYNQFIKNLLEITTELIDEKNKKIEILTQKTIRDKLLTYFEMNFKKTGSK